VLVVNSWQGEGDVAGQDWLAVCIRAPRTCAAPILLLLLLNDALQHCCVCHNHGLYGLYRQAWLLEVRRGCARHTHGRELQLVVVLRGAAVGCPGSVSSSAVVVGGAAALQGELLQHLLLLLSSCAVVAAAGSRRGCSCCSSSWVGPCDRTVFASILRLPVCCCSWRSSSSGISRVLLAWLGGCCTSC
jgi:hypothetical protein